MFRKIHSNRDPRDTVYTELKKEFKPYVSKAGEGLKAATSRYPKFIFWMMVINIVLSAVLSFTVFRHKAAAKQLKKPPDAVSPVSTGFDQIMQATAALREMTLLKKQIDSLSGKKQLNARDSLVLEKALDRFQQINHQFNSRK